MEQEIKMLISFLTEDNPKMLVTDCSSKEIIGKLKSYGNVQCTASDCKKKESCIPFNQNMPFLPMKKYDAWIVERNKLKINTGYIFHLASITLKMPGILAITEHIEDDIAIAYGFQVLYRGNWYYYLKAYEKSGSVIDFSDAV